jgi:hypothetical protein
LGRRRVSGYTVIIHQQPLSSLHPPQWPENGEPAKFSAQNNKACTRTPTTEHNTISRKYHFVLVISNYDDGINKQYSIVI